jgi:HAD superfamily hydrolase (TIGR01509 family)
MSRLSSSVYWVFDLDGTLTLPVHDFAVIRSELGVPPEADILDFLDALPPAEAALRHARLHEIELELTARTAVAPGAERLLESLAGRGARLGILTRNSREIALVTLSHLGLRDYFEDSAIIGRNEALPKPEPDGIRKLAAKWGAEPSAAVMVGDYLFDLQAGRAAGAATVHVDRTGAFRWPEYADLAVVSLAELLPLIGP